MSNYMIVAIPLFLNSFSYCSMLYHSRYFSLQSCVAPGYKAPELLVKSRYYTIACDIWSVGCIFGEMVLHDPVFTGNHELEQLFSMFE